MASLPSPSFVCFEYFLVGELSELKTLSVPEDTIKFKLTVAFDGANYSGWQVQKNGVGAQQRVEEALRRIFPGASRVHGSSRTDTGVHALGMVAHVEIPRDEFCMPVRKLALALNANLPEDVRVLSAVRCSANFHARFDATAKQYRYFVWNHTAMNPLIRRTTWQVPKPLDLERMRAAARHFVGRYDFRSFAANHAYHIKDTVRTVTRCDIRKKGPQLTFVIEGEGFLYKMCRGIVGTLVQVGLEKFSPSEIKAMLAHKDRRFGGMTAPAHGLVLWKVFYPKAKVQRPKSKVQGPKPVVRTQ